MNKKLLYGLYHGFAVHSIKPSLDSLCVCPINKVVDDIHLLSCIQTIKEFVPKGLWGQVFPAGGFCSHLLGVTSFHNDIDLFCLTDNAWQKMRVIVNDRGLPHHERNEDTSYGPLIKTELDGLKFDIVDASYETTYHMDTARLILEIFQIFDLSWSMAAINLDSNLIYYSTEVSSPSPKIHLDATKNRLNGLVHRLEKYTSRLVGKIDHDLINATREYIKILIKNGETKVPIITWDNVYRNNILRKAKIEE